MTQSRETKYSKQIMLVLQRLGHATNARLQESLREVFPDVSATTVHRATARLLERGVIGEAPPDASGSMRYDANLQPHDHFACSRCGGIRDIDIAEAFLPTINAALGGCRVTGRLLIHGTCEKCLQPKEQI